METGWYTSDQKRILDNTYIHLFKIKKSTNRLFEDVKNEIRTSSSSFKHLMLQYFGFISKLLRA